jgi:two-component system, cell cycle response regulator DivK
MNILVIEDSRMLRLVMERTLVRAGYQVTAVGDGQEGLLLAQQIHPDLILLDMMLPTLEGTAVLRQLKSNPSTSFIPVIVLSGLSQKNEEKLKTAGASAYFEKSKLDLEGNAGSLIQLVRQLGSEFCAQRRRSTV